MAGAFDPYHRWLGISPKDQPPHHYRLLGVDAFEHDLDVIENAADRQMTHLRAHQSGKHADDSQRILNEISAARVCLLDPAKKAEYDAELKKQLSEAKEKPATLKKAKPLPPAALQAEPKPVVRPTPRPERAAGTKSAKPANSSKPTRPARQKPAKPSPKSLTTPIMLAVAGGLLVVLMFIGGGVLLLASLFAKSPDVVAVVPDPPDVPRIRPKGPTPRPPIPVPPTIPPDPNPMKGDTSITDPPEDQPAEPETLSWEWLLNDDEDKGEKPATDNREPVPDTELQEKKRKQIASVFPLADDSTFDEKVAHAKKLRHTGIGIKGDKPAEYVLFEMSREVAASAGDSKVAMQAIDELDKRFQVQAVKLRADTIATAAKSDVDDSVKKETVRQGLAVIDQLLTENNPTEADRLVTGLLAVTENLNEAGQIAELTKRRNQGRQLLDNQKATQEARKTLLENPEDTDAALTLGKHFAFDQGDWQRGLPLLAAGSDEKLKSLAENEIAVPTLLIDRKRVADGWFALGESSDGIAAEHLKARAAMWYEKIKDDVKGLTKAQVERRLEDLESFKVSGGTVYKPVRNKTAVVNRSPQNTPTNPSTAKPIDLLSAVNIERDRLHGAWRLSDGQLFSPTTYGAVLKLPATVPDEYQLAFDVERKSGKNAFVVGLVSNGRQFQATLGYDERRPNWGHVSALEDLDRGRVTSSQNTTTTKGYPFRDSGRSKVICTVKKNQVTVTVDGKQTINFQGDAARLSLPSYWRTRVKTHPGLWVGSYACAFAISKIELTPLTQPATPEASGATVDLLALIDVSKDSTRGRWNMVNGNLVSPKQAFASLQIPYLPPDEYEVEAIVSTDETNLDFTMGLVREGRQFGVTIDGYGHMPQPLSGIDYIDRVRLSDGNITAHSGRVGERGKQNRFVFRVTKEKVTFHGNDKKIAEFDGRSTRLYKSPHMLAPNKQALYLSAFGRTDTIHSLKLTPISGQGRPLRGNSTSQPTSTETVDLLKLINLDQRDYRRRFRMEGSDLVTLLVPFNRMVIPYHPPEEYDLEVELTRVTDIHDIAIGLVYQGKQCSIGLDRYEGKQTDLMVDMRTNSNGVARYSGKAIPAGSPAKVTCQVRKDHLKVLVEGKELLTYRGKATWNGMNEFWRVQDPQALMIGSHRCAIRVHSMKLTPIKSQSP